MAGSTVESSLPAEEPEIELPLDDPEPEPDEDAAVAATEARAREMGWKPLAEYRGPPGRWQPAADFISRGENILPILRDQFRRQGEELGKIKSEFNGLRSTVDEQLKIIKDLRDLGATANQRGYERAMAEIKANQRKAVEAGNTEAYDQLVAQAEALQESRPAAAASTTVEAVRPAATPPPSLTPTTQDFIRENPWFNTDKLLSDTMVAFHQEVLTERQATQAILNTDPELDRDLLEEAKSRVMARYPERFSAQPTRLPRPTPAARPARRAASVAAPTSDQPAPRPGSVPATINSIADPAERVQARDSFNRAKRQMPDYTEAEYMALYSDPHGDILALQHKPRSGNVR
jgi:hypothetical protein